MKMRNQPEATMTPYDIELNTAVHRLAQIAFHTGYDVVKSGDVPELMTHAEYMREHPGRVPVAEETSPDHSLFADAEIEQDFRALIGWGLQHPLTVEGHDHPGEICSQQLADTTKRIEELMVSVYGDDDRTRRWSRELTLYFLVNMGFHLRSGEVGWDRRELFAMAMKLPLAKQSAGEMREQFLSYVAKIHAQSQQVIVVNSEEELHELLERLGVDDDGNVPHDDTGRQNAPTSGAHN
jgi:hypothetical protein